MGSGSSIVACLNTKRNFIGMEKDPEYYQLANERVNQVKLRRLVFEEE